MSTGSSISSSVSLVAILQDHARQLRDLRGAILGLRMVPFAEVLARLPLVMRGLQRSTDKEVRLLVSDANDAELDKAVAERVFPALVHLLMVSAVGDADERIREAALGGLPMLEDPRATEAILKASAHQSAKTRAAAVRALGSTSNTPEIVGVVWQRLADEDPWVRYYACQSLAKLQVREAADDIVARIGDDAGQVRVAAVEALAHLRSPCALRALMTAAESTDPDLRRAAILGLGAVRDPSTLPLLRGAAGSSDTTTRLVAVSALAEFDLAEVVPTLGQAASDPHPGVSSAAIGFLSTRPGDAATKVLIELLANPAVQEAALAALAVALEGRTETILAALETATSTLAEALVSALVRMRRPSALAAIAAVRSFENVAARRAAGAALAAVGTREALDALRQYAMNDLDPEVRRIALAAAPG
jgi:HEAT repeat protein